MTSLSLRRAASWHDGEVELAAAVGELEALYAALPALACKGLCQPSCDEHAEASDLEHARARTACVDLTTPTPTAPGACPAPVATFGAGHCAIHPVRPMVCRLWGFAALMPCPHGCLPDLAGWSAPTGGERGHRSPGAATAALTIDPTTDQVADDGVKVGVDVAIPHDVLLRAGRPAPAGAVGQPRQAPSRPEGTARHSERLAAPVRPPVRLPDGVVVRSMMPVLRLGAHDTAVPGVTDLLEAYASDELAAGLMALLLRGDTSVKLAPGVRLQQLRAVKPLRTAPPSAPHTAAATTPSGSTGGETR